MKNQKNKKMKKKEGEKAEEEKGEPEPEKPEIRPFFVEMKENEAFRKEFILLCENVLNHVRNRDGNRNLSEALKECIKNHSLITSHPDFHQFLPFLEMGAIHMQPYAVFFAAIGKNCDFFFYIFFNCEITLQFEYKMTPK